MCKLLALLALMANSNANASANTSAGVSTASTFSTIDNVVPTHSSGTAVAQKPNAELAAC